MARPPILSFPGKGGKGRRSGGDAVVSTSAVHHFENLASTLLRNAARRSAVV